MTQGELLQEDREIIQACQQGAEESFRQLLERYEASTYAVAYNMVYDWEAARDISQEVWLKIYFNINKFDLNQNFYPWLCRITTNLCTDYLRRHRQKPKPISELVEKAGVSSDNPAKTVEVSETQEKVRALLQKLPVKYRTVLVLSDIDGLSSAEVSKSIKCNDATVRWRLHKARKLFKKIWEKEQNKTN